MKNLITKLFNRAPILKYILVSFVKGFLIAALFLGAVFAALWFTGAYSELESILDLKYNSPFVLVPMYAFAALAVLCFFIGFLLWFHKYKRSKTRSSFGKAVSRVLDSTKRLMLVAFSILVLREALLSGAAAEVFASDAEDLSVSSSDPSVSSGDIPTVDPEPISPVEGTDYLQNTPNGDNGWYKSGGALEITPTGLFDQIREEEDGEWKSELIKSEETPASGTEVTFYLANSTTGEISGSQTVTYRLDNTAPDGESAEPRTVYVTEEWDVSGTSGQNEWEREYLGDVSGNDERNTDNFLYHVTLAAEDALSGVSYFQWKYKNSDSWSEPVSAVDGTAQISVNYNQWYADRGIDIMTCDMAGNLSGEISMPSHNFLMVEYDRVHFQRYVNRRGEDVSEENMDGSTRLIYNQAEAVKLTVLADVFEETEITVAVNDTPINVKWSAEDSEYVGIFELSEGDSVVKIAADGYSILSSETGSKVVMGEYISNTHTVDATVPVISVSFDEAVPAWANIYTSDRSMTVSVTDRNFRPNELSFSELSAKNLSGGNVSDFHAEDFLNALKNALWKTEGDVHSATVVFSIDAFYDFTLEYSDMANNPAVSCHAEPFAIDKAAPGSLRITYSSNPVSMLSEAASFGYYNPSVTVRLYAEDWIAGVDHFNWTYMREEGASTTMNVDMVSEQIDCTDSEYFSYEEGGRTAVAEFTLTADEFVQYRGSISFTATDKAGHTSAVHYGDGTVEDGQGELHNTSPNHVLVVDTTAPLREVTYLEPQKTREEDSGPTIYYDGTYGDTIPVTLKITEANFYAEDVAVTINNAIYVIDDWSQDGDEWTGTIRLREDGAYVIAIAYTDRSGNQMLSYQSERIVIDRVKPVIDRYEFTPELTDNDPGASDFVEVLEYGYYFKTEFVVSIYASDAAPSSGLDRIDFRLVSYENGVKKDEAMDSLPVVGGMAELIVPAGFKGQIFAQSCDIVGNKSDEVTPKAFVVDKTAPTIEVVNSNTTGYNDAEGNSLYVTDMSVTVTIMDNISGIRKIGYAQSSENASYDRIEIILENSGYQAGDELGDGWVISEMDANLVTKVAKQFTYDSDDNNIMLIFDAADSSGNIIEGVTSDKFTIDKTDPVIDIAFRADDDTDVYYDADRVADIIVTERNFDASLIKVMIENKFGNIPDVSFTDVSNTEHTAVIVFGEGDYTFEVSGMDMGSRAAAVNYSGGNEHLFYVDKTRPVVADNFVEFSSDATKNSFNMDKTVNISVTEHNFDPALVQLHILKKAAGSNHSITDLQDVTTELVGYSSWVDNEDVHTITFTVSADAVYQIEMSPADLAGNEADYRSTVVFEIDQTVPIVSARNGNYVSYEEVAFLDTYTYDRRDEPAPTVEFSDINLDYIRYDLTVWIPNRSNPEDLLIMRPEKVYLDKDSDKTGIISGSSFTLPDFTEDGIYALELTAVDVAGNESVLNVNTYARMVEQDVLAYILESNVEDKTGLYSFQYENGTPISMRPDNFSDLSIFAIAREDTDVDIVLRDTNAEEIPVDAQVATDHSVYGVVIYHFVLESVFFKDTFSGDTDAELYLVIKNDGERIDLGQIHIDNMAPTCDLPEDFRSWNWYFGEETRTITVSNISELLDVGNCKVYDNGNEIRFAYSSEDSTLSFTLEKGWHSVGLVICDMAGNANNIQERVHMYVGYLWLWIIIAGAVGFFAAVIIFCFKTSANHK